MTADRWVAILGVLVGVAAIVVPLLLRQGDRRRIENEKLRAENQRLRDANTDLKIALSRFLAPAEAMTRAFNALPSEGTTP